MNTLVTLEVPIDPSLVSVSSGHHTSEKVGASTDAWRQDEDHPFFDRGHSDEDQPFDRGHSDEFQPPLFLPLPFPFWEGGGWSG